MADEAVCIGPPPSNQSYLVIQKVVDACKKTEAQAVSKVLFINLIKNVNMQNDLFIIFSFLMFGAGYMYSTLLLIIVFKKL